MLLLEIRAWTEGKSARQTQAGSSISVDHVIPTMAALCPNRIREAMGVD